MLQFMQKDNAIQCKEMLQFIQSQGNASDLRQCNAINLDESLTYKKKSIQILDQKVKELRTKWIPLIKILWRNHEIEKTTREVEEEIRAKYPELFSNQCENFENEILLKGRECENPHFKMQFS